MKRMVCSIMALAVVAAMALTGCAAPAAPAATEAPTQNPTAAPSDEPAAEPSASDASDALSGEIMITGSTSAEPLVTVLSDLFMEKNSGVSIAVQGNGSSAGIKAAGDGAAQLGMSSRALKAEEETTVTAHTICMDGIAVIVSKDNPVKALTREQIAQIFKGEITNWKDLGGNDEEILLISREAGSGTRDAFEEICGLVGEDENGNSVTLVDESKAIIADSTNAVSTNVSTRTNAIGYISLGSYDSEQVQAVDVDGVACTAENILANTYAIARPFVLATGPATDEAAQAFLDYILSEEGQAVVSEEGFIPVA